MQESIWFVWLQDEEQQESPKCWTRTEGHIQTLSYRSVGVDGITHGTCSSTTWLEDLFLFGWMMTWLELFAPSSSLS